MKYKATLILMFAFFMLLSCERVKDKLAPCADTHCFNGGHCVDGSCKCPPGWSGTQCNQENTPSLMYLVKIEVTDIKARVNGQSRSMGTGPDIYVRFDKKDSSGTIWTSLVYNDADSIQTYTFKPSKPLPILPHDRYRLMAFDNVNPINPEFADGVEFIPYVGYLGFPKVTIIPCYGCRFVWIVTYSYVW